MSRTPGEAASRFDHRWQRFFASCCVVFAVLTGAGLEGFWPQPPSFNLSARATAHYYVAHRSGMLIGITLATIGMAFLLAWTVQYGLMLWRQPGGSPALAAVTLACLVASPILLSFDLVLFAVATFRAASTNPDVTRALSDIAWIGSELIWPMLGGGMALAGVLIRRTSRHGGDFPAWLGWLTLLVAAIEPFQIPIIFVKTGPFAANGLFAWYCTVGSWGIWALATGLVMWRSLGPAARQGAVVPGRDGPRATLRVSDLTATKGS